MPEPITLDFQTFWGWLVTHPNCILRAGTPEAVVYDDDDLHWHFAEENPETLLVQVMRGKRPVAEILLQHEPVTYVQGTDGEQEGEYGFELVAENEKGRFAVYFFVLTHGFDGEGALHKERVH